MRELQVADFEWWVVLGSNQWPLPCEAAAPIARKVASEGARE